MQNSGTKYHKALFESMFWDLLKVVKLTSEVLSDLLRLFVTIEWNLLWGLFIKSAQTETMIPVYKHLSALIIQKSYTEWKLNSHLIDMKV